MSSVVILPVTNEQGAVTFRAISNLGQSEGATAGQALDALRQQSPAQAGSTLVVLQPFEADEYFTESQRTRLGELMDRWRAARDSGSMFPSAEQDELQSLTEAEFQAATRRTARMLKDTGG